MGIRGSGVKGTGNRGKGVAGLGKRGRGREILEEGIIPKFVVFY